MNEKLTFEGVARYRARVHPDTPNHVRYAIHDSLDPILHDLMALFQLPLPVETRHPWFHFTIAHGLLAIVAGVSRLLFDPTERFHPGGAFLSCLKFYPWSQEPHGGMPEGVAIKALYSEFRNPLAHALGVNEERRGGRIIQLIRMAPWKPEELERLTDRIHSRPPNWPPTLQQSANSIQINLDCLHWGIRTMIYSLTSDVALMDAAQNVLSKLDHPFGSVAEYKRLAFGEDASTDKKIVLAGSSLLFGGLPNKGAIGPTPRISWKANHQIWPWNKRK